MLETPREAAERILLQVRRRPDCAIFYVAWGNSLRFIGFSRADYSFSQYGEDCTRLVGAYRRGVLLQDLADDIECFLKEKGFL